jgi:hypothetical protein
MTMSNPKISVEILHNVVQIESDPNEQIFIQLKRGGRLDQFQDTACCMGKCPKCGKIFIVFFKTSDLKCPECITPVDGYWTYALVNTWGKDGNSI